MSKYTDEELKAIQTVINVTLNIFSMFGVLGIDGQGGLMKSILRTSLFMAEEAEQGKNPDKEAIKEMIVNDFREDQKRKEDEK